MEDTEVKISLCPNLFRFITQAWKQYEKKMVVSDEKAALRDEDLCFWSEAETANLIKKSCVFRKGDAHDRVSKRNLHETFWPDRFFREGNTLNQQWTEQ